MEFLSKEVSGRKVELHEVVVPSLELESSSSLKTVNVAAAATGAGSSRSATTAPAKRAREPTPPPRRTGGEPDFDLSALSSDDKEEE